MFNRTFGLTLLVTTIAAMSVLLLLPKPSAIEFDLLIKNANVLIDGQLRANTDIAISNGKISAIAKDIRRPASNTLDASNKTVIPGLIDAHTHTYGQGLRQALRFGVSTQIDMFTAPELLSSIRRNPEEHHETDQADLFSSGMLATSANGHGTQFGIPVETLSQHTDIQQWIADRKAEGSDFIKLVYMPYNSMFASLDKETASQLIEHAQAADLKAVAHISSQRAAQDMLDANIDGLVHQFADSEVSNAFLAQATAQGIFMIPTLSVIGTADHQDFANTLSDNSMVNAHLDASQKQHLNQQFGTTKLPGFNYQVAARNTKRMFDAGIPILAGSDAPNPGTTFGASLHQEMQLLVAAGLSPTQALNAATLAPIEAFAIADRGAIKVGHLADLVVLNSSPISDISSTLDIYSIIKNGRLVDRTVNSKPTMAAASLANGSLSEFNSGLNNQHSMRWVATDDSVRQGQSKASIGLSDQTLKIKATVKEGFVFAWAGTGVFAQSTVDISDYTRLSFKVRGTPGQYSALAFSGEQSIAPASQAFDINETWSTIELDLHGFSGLNMTTTIGFAIVAGPTPGEFVYYLDDVKLH